MPWEPTTDAEFDEWIKPLDALDVFDIQMADDHDKRAILERLKGEALVAVARSGWQYSSTGEAKQAFVRVPARAWRMLEPNDENYFWVSGDLVAEGIADSFRFFDIRFHPDAFSGSGAPPVSRSGKADPVILARAAVDSVLPPDPGPDKRPNLTPTDASKFCKLLLEGWPDTTEREAHKRAAGFFNEKKVPKHWFLEIFRSIRGEKNPGPKPKTGRTNQ